MPAQIRRRGRSVVSGPARRRPSRCTRPRPPPKPPPLPPRLPVGRCASCVRLASSPPRRHPCPRRQPPPRTSRHTPRYLRFNLLFKRNTTCAVTSRRRVHRVPQLPRCPSHDRTSSGYSASPGLAEYLLVTASIVSHTARRHAPTRERPP